MVVLSGKLRARFSFYDESSVLDNGAVSKDTRLVQCLFDIVRQEAVTNAQGDCADRVRSKVGELYF